MRKPSWTWSAPGDLHDSVLVSSFHLPTIDRVHALDPEVPTGYLVVVDPLPLPALEIAHEHGHSGAASPRGRNGRGVRGGRRGPRRGARDRPERLDRERAAEIVRLAALGVDGIITDTPRIARHALGRE